MEYYKLEAVTEALSKMCEHRIRNYKIAKRLFDLQAKALTELEFYNKELYKLIDTYGKRDDEGKLVHTAQEDGKINYTIADPQSYKEAFFELANTLADLPLLTADERDGIVDALDNANYEFNATDISLLEVITKEA